MDLIDREQLKSTIRKMVEIPNETRAQVIGAISRAKAVDGWFPVTERLPEDDLPDDSEVKLIKVLVFYKTSMGVPVVRTQIRQKGSRYHRDEWSWAKFEPITHWMPLPQAPKGE